ncbi:MAG: hypothetical protein AAFX04_04000 [Pseudomonadota bacterium]
MNQSLTHSYRGRSLSLFGLISGLCVGIGAYLMISGNVLTSASLGTALAWAIGAVLAIACACTRLAERGLTVLTCIGGAALTLTLFQSGQDDVTRWLAIGSVRLNAAMLTLPWIVVAMAQSGFRGRIYPAIAVVLAIILAIQPDPSQAFAFAAAMGVVALHERNTKALLIAAISIGTALVAIWRNTPLPPIPHVELIIEMAFETSSLLGFLLILLLAAGALFPALLARQSGRSEGLALTAYLAVATIAPAFGWFPVPWAGAGMSFPIGIWLAIGLLLSASKPD